MLNRTPDVPTLESPVLTAPRIRHAFFTRGGGVSQGIYASLNCGLGSDDDATLVAENRARAMQALGLAPEALLTLHQVHSADALVVETPFGDGDRPRCDGMATRRPGLALGVLSADCAPVLFADAEAGIVGAAHAGWRGALDGVVEATVARMEELGARRDRIAAAVGPCIGFASYEVGPEFPERFAAGPISADPFFVAAERAGHFRFDLQGYVAARLAAAGLGAVDAVPGDTCAEPARFFSYRRACLTGEADYARGLSAIAVIA